MKRALGIILAMAASVAVAAAAPGRASAGEGSWGGFGNGAGYCWDDRDWNATVAVGAGWRILGSAPVMYPADDAPQPAGFFVGPPHQWVGYVITLQRWNGTAWYGYKSTGLRVQEANTAFHSDVWYDTRTGNWISGLTEFRFADSGYYRLRYDLYWYGLNWEVTGTSRTTATGFATTGSRRCRRPVGAMSIGAGTRQHGVIGDGGGRALPVLRRFASATEEIAPLPDHSYVAGVRVAELELLYRAKFPTFLRVAAAIVRDEDLALDAVHDAFASAIRNRRRFRGEGPLDAWLWRMVVNAALKARRPRPEVLVEPSVNGASPAEAVDLRAAIELLPERQRTVLFLRYFADLDYRAIAAALDVTPGTVGSTLNAAHAALRRSLEEVPR